MLVMKMSYVSSTRGISTVSKPLLSSYYHFRPDFSVDFVLAFFTNKIIGGGFVGMN